MLKDYLDFELRALKSAFFSLAEFVRKNVLWEVFWASVSGSASAISAFMLGHRQVMTVLQAGAVGFAVVMLAILLGAFCFYLFRAPYLMWRQEKKGRLELAGRYEGEEKDFRIPLLELMQYADNHGWKILHPYSLEALDIERGLHQACVDGLIRVWGKWDRFTMFYSDTPLKEVPSDVWDQAKIDVVSTIQFNQRNNEHHMEWGINSLTQIKRIDFENADYRDIHLERSTALKWLENEALRYKGQHDQEHESKEPEDDTTT